MTTTSSDRYYPHAVWNEDSGERSAIVWSEHGLIRIVRWVWSTRGTVRHFHHFEAVLHGRVWIHRDERPPSTAPTEAGLERMARRWIRELATLGTGGAK